MESFGLGFAQAAGFSDGDDGVMTAIGAEETPVIAR